jgi:hypothetical protein
MQVRGVNKSKHAESFIVSAIPSCRPLHGGFGLLPTGQSLNRNVSQPQSLPTAKSPNPRVSMYAVACRFATIDVGGNRQAHAQGDVGDGG